MTQTQKKYLVWPILLFLFWLAQALEISLVHIPVLRFAHIHLTPILCIYIALTRSWGKIALLSAVFGILAIPAVGYPASIYVAVLMWTSLGTKGVVSALALEGRRPFSMMVFASHAFLRILTWFLLRNIGQALPLGITLHWTLLSALTAAVLGWFLFPIFVAWDDFFEHEADEARDLNPNVLR